MGSTAKIKEQLESFAAQWNPLPIDHLLDHHSLKEGKVQIILGVWLFLIALSITSVILLPHSQSLMNPTSEQSYYTFFMMYPPLFLGTLLLFWMGFEWGFIPVFISAFMIAFGSQMTYYWALLFAIGFVLGLAIYGLAYYSTPISPDLRSLKSIAFYTMVSFVAAIASSLGSFVWSLYHDLSAAASITIWKGWWTGVFLQSILLVGPFLFFFTPTMEHLKERHFDIPEPKVTMKWVYTAIIAVVVVLSLFIYGGNMLGASGLQEELAALPNYYEQAIINDIIGINDSFQIISFISIAIVLASGLGGIYLVGTWNKNLQGKVHQKTQQLKKSENRLQDALEEREVLLKEIHDRVRNNLTIMLALLELQLKNKEDKPLEEILKDSHSRIRSMALIHETMHQSETIDKLNMKKYAIKLSNRLRQSFERQDQRIDVSINVSDIYLDIDQAVPFAMILNELMVNAYMHAFKGLSKGTIFVEIRKSDEEIILSVRDNGIGLPSDFERIKSRTLGMKLIQTLVKQLHGNFQIEDKEKTSFTVAFPVQVPAAEAEMNL